MGLRRTLRKLLGYKEPEIHLNAAYSQEGEDLLLYRIFGHQPKGFFVDVGAHHPVRFSNTYKLYNLGWNGINLDATPGSMAPFKISRPLDINLEVPVSNSSETLPFYIFSEPALNTFSKETADNTDGKSGVRLEKVINIPTQTLAQILDTYLPKDQVIDFLSIDVEGFDYQILLSNNWHKYRPKIVLVESELEYQKLISSELHSFMTGNNYEFYAKTVRTYFYKEVSFKCQ